MALNVNSASINNFNWNSLMDKINDTVKTADVRSVSFDVSTKNVTFIVGDGDGVRTIDIEFPDLDSPGVIDQAEFDSLIEKLGKDGGLNFSEEDLAVLSKAFAEICGMSLPPRTGNVMFDLYALLALMFEAMQKLRDAAREIRTADNQAIQNSIQNQADMQREAAITGMIAAVAVGLIQIGMQCGQMLESIKADAAEMQAMSKSGVGKAQMNLADAKTEFKVETAKLEQMQNIKVAQDNVAARQTEVAQRTKTFNQAAQEMQNCDSNLKTAQQELKTARSELNALDKNAPADVRQAAETRVADAEAAVETAETDLATAKFRHLFAEEELNVSNGELEHAQQALDVAKQGYDGPVVTEDALATQKILVDAKADKLKEAAGEAQDAQARLNADADYHDAKATQAKLQTLGGIFNAIGGALQGIFQNIVQVMQSGATEEGAQQKKAEEEADQIKDIFMQTQDVIKAMMDLGKAILQADTAAMNDAIRAI